MADFVIPELSEEEAQSKMDAYEGVPPRPATPPPPPPPREPPGAAFDQPPLPAVPPLS